MSESGATTPTATRIMRRRRSIAALSTGSRRLNAEQSKTAKNAMSWVASASSGSLFVKLARCALPGLRGRRAQPEPGEPSCRLRRQAARGLSVRLAGSVRPMREQTGVAHQGTRASGLPSLNPAVPTRHRLKEARSSLLAPAGLGPVQRLAELQNEIGSGYGRANQPGVSRQRGRLAASAGCAVATFVLAGLGAPPVWLCPASA
jgi:hypothetical protein